MGGITLLNFKTFYKYNNQDNVVLAEGQTVSQLNRIENPEIDLHMYNQLIFEKGTKDFNGGGKAFQQMVMEQLDIHSPKKTQKVLIDKFGFIKVQNFLQMTLLRQ